MRLFVALDLPAALRAQIAARIADLAPVFREARWIQPDALHITLKFIGSVPDEKLPSIREALSPIRLPAPVDLEYRDLAFQPNAAHPRVLWCAIHASPNLAELAADIERALEPLGIASESRAFRPHLTLARFGRSARPGDLVRAVNGMAPQTFTSACATEFHLYESILKSTGSEYRKLQTYSLARSHFSVHEGQKP